MPHKRPDGTTQFSLKLPEGLREDVEAFAQDRRWSRSQAVVYLLEEGIDTDVEPQTDDDEQNIGDQPVVSAGTKNEAVVAKVETLAEEEYDDSFNAAARATLRKGLAATESN